MAYNGGKSLPTSSSASVCGSRLCRCFVFVLFVLIGVLMYTCLNLMSKNEALLERFHSTSHRLNSVKLELKKMTERMEGTKSEIAQYEERLGQRSRDAALSKQEADNFKRKAEDCHQKLETMAGELKSKEDICNQLDKEYKKQIADLRFELTNMRDNTKKTSDLIESSRKDCNEKATAYMRQILEVIRTKFGTSSLTELMKAGIDVSRILGSQQNQIPQSNQEQAKPGQEQSKQGQEQPKPGQEQPKPGQEQPKPGQEQPKPGQEQPKPGQEQPKPGQEQPKPGQEQPKSGQELPKLGQEQPKPGQEQPEPGQEQPKPGQEQPKSGQEPPKLGQEQPNKPGQEQPKPDQDDLEPGQESLKFRAMLKQTDEKSKLNEEKSKVDNSSNYKSNSDDKEKPKSSQNLSKSDEEKPKTGQEQRMTEDKPKQDETSNQTGDGDEGELDKELEVLTTEKMKTDKQVSKEKKNEEELEKGETKLGGTKPSRDLKLGTGQVQKSSGDKTSVGETDSAYDDD